MGDGLLPVASEALAIYCQTGRGDLEFAIDHEGTRWWLQARMLKAPVEIVDEERELCDLLWYQGLTQPEAAALLDVPERTLKRRWQTVRLKLIDLLEGNLP